MRRNDRQFATLAIILVLFWLIPHPSSAQTEDPYAFDDEYESGDFGRVTYQENGVTIHRAFADPGLPPISDAGVNSPVYPGDALLTGPDQRVEVQVASGSLIRVDRATDVTFQSLPDPYAEFPDNTVLQLSEGTLRITTRLGESEEFRIDTQSSSIYFLGDGDFRIEVTPGGRTEVISRRGVAEVVGNGGSILVQGGMRTEVFPGTLPEEAWAFNTFVTDNFDHWVDERDAIYRVGDRYAGAPEFSAEAYETMPEEVQPYYQELSHHGDWTYVEEYGHVWYPASVPAEWQPYRDGYWDYGPGGYFWVSHEPWGWAPYHYGRWNWVAGFGWCWVPGRVFSGAWVAWSWGSSHVGWAAMDFWGRPCNVRNIYYGYYDPHTWTFVDYAHIGHRNYHRYAVRVEDVGVDIHHARVVTRAPRVSPTRLATSREARQRAMRMVENDSASRMRPVDRSARPTTTMNDVERRIRRGAAARRRADGATAGASDRSAPGRSRTTDRRSTARGGQYPSYPSRIGQDRPRGDDNRRRNVGRRTPESSRRDDTRAGAENPPSTSRVRPRETERAGTDQRVRDLYRKLANPRPAREGSSTVERRQPTSSSQRDRSTRSSTPKRSTTPRSTTRSSTPKRSTTPRSTTRSSTPKRSTTPRSTTRSSTPKRPSTPRSTTRSSTPKRSSTPRSTTRSSTPKTSPTPRASSRKSTSSSSRSKSTSGGKSKSKSGSRGKKR